MVAEVLQAVGAGAFLVIGLHLVGVSLKACLVRRWVHAERAEHQADRERLELLCREMELHFESCCARMEDQLLLLAQRHEAFWTLAVRESLRILLDSGPMDRDEWRLQAAALRARGEHPIRLALLLAEQAELDPERVREVCPYSLERE